MGITEYKNKKISILGDSISTFEGYSQPANAVFYDKDRKLSSGILTVLDTWWGMLIDELDAEFLVNNSISGSTVTWNSLYEVESYGCSDARTKSLGKDGVDPDIIIVYLGLNDWGMGVKLTSDCQAEDKTSLAIFSVAYRKMLEKLKKNYPNAEIWCLTLPISRCSQNEKFAFPYYNGGWHIAEYCEVIRNSALSCNCEIIDLYKYSEPYDTIDGFHPNREGMRKIAEGILTILNQDD